jgi:hypothetical protein
LHASVTMRLRTTGGLEPSAGGHFFVTVPPHFFVP